MIMAIGKPVLHLVSETKGLPMKDNLQPNECRHIQCDVAHSALNYSRKWGYWTMWTIRL